LHLGSVVAACASYADALAHGGRWLIRMEDLDTPRMVPGADKTILQQLAALGMQSQGEVMYQSKRLFAYQAAFDRLLSLNLVYPCCCTRKEIADSVLRLQGTLLDGERPYPGTCRQGLQEGRQALSWRLRVPEGLVRFEDRWLGPMEQNVTRAVGDFVLKRADGIWAYQLAVVVDDAAQQVTHIVRGEDLLSSTARQQQLAGLLGYEVPRVLHVPLVTDASGLKLSKQNHASAIELANPLETLQKAWLALGFERLGAKNLTDFWTKAACVWGQRLTRANLHGIN
jgi:glutamyl-Q tRNA(Asp) synthetase